MACQQRAFAGMWVLMVQTYNYQTSKQKPSTQIARSLCPSMIMHLTPAKVLMPVIAGAQCLHVAENEASAPHLTAPPVEDCRLLDASLVQPAGNPVSSASRKAFFSKCANRSGRVFNINTW